MNFRQAPDKLKFFLWDFARRYPTLGQPVRAMAVLATRNTEESYKADLARRGKTILPKDRYERPIDCPTGVLVLTDRHTTADHVDGLRLFLNHLRIPYRVSAFGQALPSDL